MINTLYLYMLVCSALVCVCVCVCVYVFSIDFCLFVQARSKYLFVQLSEEMAQPFKNIGLATDLCQKPITVGTFIYIYTTYTHTHVYVHLCMYVYKMQYVCYVLCTYAYTV